MKIRYYIFKGKATIGKRGEKIPIGEEITDYIEIEEEEQCHI